jgi:CheY-like chemotaxis protein
MSLVGNLEDLSLPDILQIISLSKRSGILTIKRGGDVGTVVIRDGKIVQAFSPSRRENLGEILVREGLLSLHQLVEAVEIQKREGMTRRLGAILVERRFVEPTVLKEVVRKQIETAVFDLLLRNEGSFSFELRDVSAKNDISVDPELFVLEKGLDTQWLVMEGTRRLDESARNEPEIGESAEEIEKALDDSIDQAMGGGAVPPVIYIVDDELLISDLLATGIRAAGFRVESLETCPEALKVIKGALAKGGKAVVVVDLVMPTLDGRGFLGGLELIRELKTLDPSIPIIALSPSVDTGLGESAKDLNVIDLLVKPDHEGNDISMVNTQLEQFTGKLTDLIRAVVSGETVPSSATAEGDPPQAAAPPPETAPPPPVREIPPSRPPSPSVVASAEVARAKMTTSEGREEALIDLRAQLMEELGEQRSQVNDDLSEAVPLNATNLAFLKEMIEELHNPTATTEVSLLILRFATELVDRAVLFLVKDQEIRGLGGFGLEQEYLSKVRKVAILRGEPSLLNEVVEKGRTYKGPLPNTPGDKKMIEQLGGGYPSEVLVMPLISKDRTIVLLYGDNLPNNLPIPAADLLEIFISQAGMVMEKALLEARLKEIEERGP